MNDQFNTTFLKAHTEWKNGNYSEALPVIEALAKDGHVRSIYILGQSYQNSFGKDADIQAAIQLYKNAVTNNDPYSALSLALIYDPDNKIEYSEINKDEKLSQKYYKLAFQEFSNLSLKDNSEAMYNLANCYMCGWGCDIDFLKAKEWKTKSCKAGYLLACKEIKQI